MDATIGTISSLLPVGEGVCPGRQMSAFGRRGLILTAFHFKTHSLKEFSQSFQSAVSNPHPSASGHPLPVGEEKPVVTIRPGEAIRLGIFSL